jgi:hypothetical protein
LYVFRHHLYIPQETVADGLSDQKYVGTGMTKAFIRFICAHSLNNLHATSIVHAQYVHGRHGPAWTTSVNDNSKRMSTGSDERHESRVRKGEEVGYKINLICYKKKYDIARPSRD